jgi:hypothetical protein
MEASVIRGNGSSQEIHSARASRPVCYLRRFRSRAWLQRQIPSNGPTLNTVADALKRDPAIGLDLTFLIRSATTGYPSVIDAKPFDGTAEHKRRAHEEAEKIIRKFGLNARNPY